jgi:hypothetical protein
MWGVVRRINPWTAVPLLVVAALLAIIGAIQVPRALPKPTITARGEVFGSQYEPGGRYSGESWDVYVEEPGHGSQIAYSHALYDVIQKQDPLSVPPVTVHLRGALVTEVDLAGHQYHTSAISRTGATIAAVVLFALCALTLAGLGRTVRRDVRRTAARD